MPPGILKVIRDLWCIFGCGDPTGSQHDTLEQLISSENQGKWVHNLTSSIIFLKGNNLLTSICSPS